MEIRHSGPSPPDPPQPSGTVGVSTVVHFAIICSCEFIQAELEEASPEVVVSYVCPKALLKPAESVKTSSLEVKKGGGTL